MDSLPVGKPNFLDKKTRARKEDSPQRRHSATYYAKPDKKAKLKAYSDAYYLKNKEKIKARHKAYRNTTEARMLRRLSERKRSPTGLSREEWEESIRPKWPDGAITRITKSERENLISRISKKIFKDPESNCWIYNGRRLRKRKVWYASFRSKTWPVTRLVYLITHYQVNKYDTLLHTCRVKECVNPKHLYAYTGSD